MAVYCGRVGRWGADPIELDRQPQHELDFKIDLNSATWVEWSQLPGIGPVLAKRIVEDREQNGPFRDVDDLNRVRGIGAIKLDAIRPFIRDDSSSDHTKPVENVPR
jgi:competence protein ComEA